MEKLLPYVRGREPLEIIDVTAADVKSGKIDPLLLNFEQAVHLMVENPTLIKGPLVQVDNYHIQGIRDRRLDKYLKTQTKKTNLSLWRKERSTRKNLSTPNHAVYHSSQTPVYSYA